MTRKDEKGKNEVSPMVFRGQNLERRTIKPQDKNFSAILNKVTPF